MLEEYRVVRPNGSVRWVHTSGTLIRNGSSAVVAIGGVARDITEKKEAEERLLRSQRLENLGMLAAGIAHDFNNALAPIMMGASLLRAQAGADSAGLLDTIEKCAVRGTGLVRQLLSFAHGVGGQRKLLQLRHLLEEVANLAATTFPKSIEIRKSLPGDLCPVNANPTQWHQVFLNLCVNARDAMPQGGALSFAAANCQLDAGAAAQIPGAVPGRFVAVEVRDTGTGIPPAVLPRIWDPFYTTKGEGRGTGLGLSTVAGILHQHGGFVAVATALGQGTAYLPAASGGVEVARDGQADAPPRGRGELILVVDDDDAMREITAKTLVAHGYRTLTARDGAEAIAVFAPRAADVALVLTDLHMPILGGAAVAAALRRLRPNLPVVAMSGEGTSASTREFTAAFLAKPFQIETLLRLIRLTLDGGSAAVPLPAP